MIVESFLGFAEAGRHVMAEGSVKGGRTKFVSRYLVLVILMLAGWRCF